MFDYQIGTNAPSLFPATLIDGSLRVGVIDMGDGDDDAVLPPVGKFPPIRKFKWEIRNVFGVVKD